MIQLLRKSSYESFNLIGWKHTFDLHQVRTGKYTTNKFHQHLIFSKKHKKNQNFPQNFDFLSVLFICGLLIPCKNYGKTIEWIHIKIIYGQANKSTRSHKIIKSCISPTAIDLIDWSDSTDEQIIFKQLWWWHTQPAITCSS